MQHIVRTSLIVLFTILIAGCESLATDSTQEKDDPFSPRLRASELLSVEEVEITAESVVENKALVKTGPGTDFDGQVIDILSDRLGDDLVGEKLVVSFNNMPIPAFVNEVFSEQLGLSFTLDPAVKKLTDLVTLRILDPVTPRDLFQIAQRTLAAYGIGIERQQNLYVFSLNANVARNDSPLLVTGEALPEVPESHRPYFVFRTLKIVSNNKITSWLNSALQGAEVRITQVPDGNSLLLQGKYSAVKKAMALIEALDHPLLRGKQSRIVEPAFSNVTYLANDLLNVLKTEGYDASLAPPTGSIVMLPLEKRNQLVIFAADEGVLQHVIDWVNILDRQRAVDIADGIFTYEVKNSDAEYLIELLNQLRQGDDTGENQPKRFVADRNRNTIVYKGSGHSWTEVLPALKEMDKPSPSVFVEVLLIEVTLNDLEATGFEFLARSSDVTFSTLGGFGLGATGLSATLNRAGETRAVLNAFYENKRANIRSRPRLLVKSGQEASIDVGNEIPLVTSTSQSTQGDNAPVIQTVQYRKTGVLLAITPTVHSSGFVDIKVRQELSEAQQTSTSTIDSPTIFNRKIQTTVNLRDGGSVVLGGLISESSGVTKDGVTGLGRIPVLGRLFGTRSKTRDRTELMMMIIPYILPNPDEAVELSDKLLELSNFED